MKNNSHARSWPNLAIVPKRLRIGTAGLILLVTLTGCSGAISRLNEQALVYGLEPVSSNADGFVLQSFYHPVSGPDKRWHVYREGDGPPWEQGLVPAAEPTTRASVMLPLMAIDAAPSLYLGRPCYNGHANDSGCSSTLWTEARYSERVVAAMTMALNDFIARQDYRQIVLIGHSGGGPGFETHIARFVDDKLTIIVLTNQMGSGAWELASLVAGMYEPALAPREPAATSDKK